MNFNYEGSVAYIYPDHFDVDMLIGIQNVKESDYSKLIPICMKDYDPDFAEKIKPGDILVGGRNFGYGHAHPQSIGTIRKMGINIVLAESFAPGFFRGELGNGMVLLQVPGITENVDRFDRLEVEYDKGLVRNVTKGTSLQGVVPSPIALELLQAGGSIGLIKKELKSL